MDIMDLNALHDDNLELWFEGLVNESGIDFEEQQMIYEQFTKVSAEGGGGVGGSGSGSGASQVKERSKVQQAICRFVQLQRSRWFEIRQISKSKPF